MVDIGPSNADIESPFCCTKGVFGGLAIGLVAAVRLLLVTDSKQVLVMSSFLSHNRLERLIKSRASDAPGPAGSSTSSASIKIDPSI